MDRRELIIGSGVFSAAFAAAGLGLIRSAVAGAAGRGADELARDEDFWFSVRQAYSIDNRYIILNGGASNPSPRSVYEAHLRYLALVNSSPYIHQRRGGIAGYDDTVRQRLARLINASPDEVAITRNTTEGLNICVWGIDLQPGDEILTSVYDYHTVLDALSLRENRHGIVVRKIQFPMPTESFEPILSAYRAGFTPKTKMVFLTHSLDGVGQTMPVREICAMARSNGALSVCDGALALGHIPVDVQEIGCDYYMSSLHKWISAPFASGLFFVRKDRIAATWQIFGGRPDQADNIRKFEDYGNRSYSAIAAVGDALDFYEALGIDRKACRLYYLKRYWADQVRAEPKIRFGTSLSQEHGCATIQLAIEGIEGRALFDWLYDKKRIYAWGPVVTDSGSGVYVSPNVFTPLEHLDLFVAAIREAARNGIS